MKIRNTPNTIIISSINPLPGREFAGPPVCSIHHPMQVRIAPGTKHMPAIIFLILSGIKLTPGKKSKNQAIVGVIHCKILPIEFFIEIKLIIFPSLNSKNHYEKQFARVASRMTHAKPIQTLLAFAWVFGHALTNYPHSIVTQLD